MRIFCFIVKRFRAHKQRRRTFEDRLEEMATKALLDIAGRDFRVLASVINKYCYIRVSHGYEIKKIQDNIRAEISRKAEQNILDSRGQELDKRISGIIDMILRRRNESGRRQYEERASLTLGSGGRERPKGMSVRYRSI